MEHAVPTSKASEVEDLLVERGIMFSYETIRRAPELNICED
jgi:transposase-like protein